MTTTVVETPKQTLERCAYCGKMAYKQYRGAYLCLEHLKMSEYIDWWIKRIESIESAEHPVGGL